MAIDRRRKTYSRYCINCGAKMDNNSKFCSNCGNEYKNEDNESCYKSHIKCIKCKKNNITYEIVSKSKKNIICEEKIYKCNSCGKIFKDKDRLGPTFNNYSLIVNPKVGKIVYYIVICIIVYYGLTCYQNNKQLKEDNLPKLDCYGLPVMTFKEIKDGAPYSDDKYKGNSYIFTTTIEEIKNREIRTPIEEGDYSGSYITINKDEKDKLLNYKEGDNITICGTVTKISLYHKVYVKNATIIE